MVTFKSCTDTRQISAAPNSRHYLILLVPFWKMMSFETNGLRFLVRNRAAFSLVFVLPQKQFGMLTSIGGHKSVNPLITKLTFSLTR